MCRGEFSCVRPLPNGVSRKSSSPLWAGRSWGRLPRELGQARQQQISSRRSGRSSGCLLYCCCSRWMGVAVSYFQGGNFKTILTQTVIVAFGAMGMTMVIFSGGIDLRPGRSSPCAAW
ncbi:MAG: hypothetical protein CM1200mP29_10460 [Verrucomicrobiota bacterium]|nr:MAG: hypothetical protein CM1200mP29_10460 [Verrucomicrobiota bacterium]